MSGLMNSVKEISSMSDLAASSQTSQDKNKAPSLDDGANAT